MAPIAALVAARERGAGRNDGRLGAVTLHACLPDAGRGTVRLMAIEALPTHRPGVGGT